MHANFNKINYHLSQFKQPFNIAAISATWISTEKDFELDGYEFNYINTEEKTGGGVAIYVDKNLKYRLVEKMTRVMNDIFECITVEIYMKKKKNNYKLHL